MKLTVEVNLMDLFSDTDNVKKEMKQKIETETAEQIRKKIFEK